MSSEIIIKSLLSQQAHFQVNKLLIKKVGLDEASLLSVLVEGDKMFHFVNDGWFFVKASVIQEMLNIKRKPYDGALKNLIQHGLVETKVSGCPPTTNFRLNYDKILEYCVDDGQFAQNGQIDLFQSDKLNCPESTNPYNKEIKIINKDKKEIIIKKESKQDVAEEYLSIVAPEHYDIMKMWYDHKKSKKQTYKPIGWKLCYAKFVDMVNAYGLDEATEFVEECISNNWSGFDRKWLEAKMAQKMKTEATALMYASPEEKARIATSMAFQRLQEEALENANKDGQYHINF